jgi:K+/H+ antiporter YhaU regulatory subunit KhtT
MAMASLRPNVVDFMQIAAFGEEGLTLEEIVIPDGSSLVGKSVLESSLKTDFGVTIIGIRHPGEKMILNPRPDTVFQAQDILILIGHTEKLEQLSRVLNPNGH